VSPHGGHTERPLSPRVKAYDDAFDAAKKAWEEAVEPIGESRKRAIDEARDDKAWAAAMKAHDEALRPADITFREAMKAASDALAEALGPAEKIRNDAIAPLWEEYQASIRSHCETVHLKVVRLLAPSGRSMSKIPSIVSKESTRAPSGLPRRPQHSNGCRAANCSDARHN
jgi:hypothetical protein